MGRDIYGRIIENKFGQLDDTEPNDTHVLTRLINSNRNYRNGFIPLELLNKDRRGRQRLDIRHDNDFYRLVTGNPDGIQISSVFQFQAPIDMIYYPDDVLSILPDDVMLDVIERYNDFIKKGKKFSNGKLSPILEEEEEEGEEEEKTPNLSVNLMPPLEKQLMDLKSELNKCRNEVKRCQEGKMAEKKRKMKERRASEYAATAAEKDSDSEYDTIDDTSETSLSDTGSGRRRTRRRKRRTQRKRSRRTKRKGKKKKGKKKKPKTRRKR
jgi:hypothetical protein